MRPVTTASQADDCPQAVPLLKGLQPGKEPADTAYDRDENRAYYRQPGIGAIVSSHRGRHETAAMDEETYHDRNEIERFLGRLKQFRRLATPYEKTVASFLALWHVAAALDWLR